MNGQEKLKANMACAKLVVSKGYIVQNPRGSQVVLHHILGNRDTDFNIFTNASQCLEVVKKLGDDYDISFCPLSLGGWCYEKTGVLTRIDCTFETYEEAVASAAIEVMKP